jgi:hypothetical protein
MIDLVKLIDWLGVNGAIAGLIKSDLRIQEIADLSTEKPKGSSKMKREEIIEWVIRNTRYQATKKPEELLEMDVESLREYFSKIRISPDEITTLLSSWDIRPGSTARKNLIDFAAREISDIGMYKRVSKGGKASQMDGEQ